MRDYEVMFAIRGSLASSEAKEVYDKIIKTFEKHGGKVSFEENWGMIDIAYPMKHEKTAYYYVVQYSLDPQELREVERKLELNNDVLRYLTTKLDGTEETFTKEMYDEGMEAYYQSKNERKKYALPKTRASTTAQLAEEMKKVTKEESSKKAEKKEEVVSSDNNKLDEIIDKDLSL